MAAVEAAPSNRDAVLMSRQGVYRIAIGALCSILVGGSAPHVESSKRPSVGDLTDDEAFAHLSASGLEMTWPAFISNTTLLALAYSQQGLMETPRGALPDGIRMISSSPRVYVMDDFMTSDECDYLRASARYRLQAALVVASSDNWYDTQAQTRNNEQVWLTAEEEREVPLLRHILKRMHRVARVPDDFAEALQVGRYNLSTKYEAHVDTDPPHKVARPATFIAYLNDVEGGGETLFPVGRNDCSAKWRTDPTSGEQVYGVKYCCGTPEKDAPETVRVTPKKGRAVLFFSHHPDGRVDHKSLHASCPVTKGEKWIAQRWLRFEPYQRIIYDTGKGRDQRFDGAPAPGEGAQESHVRTLSNKDPRVYLMERFLTAEECDKLVELGRWRLRRNEVASSTTSGAADSTADEAWFDAGEEDADDVLRDLRQRTHQAARMPDGSSQGMSLRRLLPGDSEKPHLDSSPQASLRPATVLIFLNDVEDGGAIVFPEAAQIACGPDLADCCASPRAQIHLRKGDAVLIYGHTLEGRLDPRSLHGLCPVLQGERWLAERHFLFAVQPQEVAAQEGGSQPLVIFENTLPVPADIYWLEPGTGAEKRLDRLDAGPGSSKEFNSYNGHIFRVRNAEDNSILMEVTTRPSGRQRHRVGDAQGGLGAAVPSEL